MVTTEAPSATEDAGGSTARSLPERARRRPSERFRREERREFRYVLSIALAIVCSWFVAVLPGRIRDWLADRGGDLYWRLAPTYRANVLANIGQVMGPAAAPEAVETAARRAFRTSARNFADLLRLPHMSREELVRTVRLVEGEWSFIDEAVARGRGVVLMAPHLGAFDFVLEAASARGYKVTAVTGRTTARFVFDAVTYLRRAHGTTLVEGTPSGVRRVIQALRRGEFAGFAADYDYFQNGMPVVFFGRPTTLPPGPIRIARDTGALVVVAFARRTDDGCAVSLVESFTVEKTADLDADLERGMARAVAILERAIAAAPDQWVMFQRVWPEEPVDPVRVFPVGSPLESELLRRVDEVLPAPRWRRDDPSGRSDPAGAPTDRTEPPPQSPHR